MLIKRYTNDLLKLINQAQRDPNLELEVILQNNSTNEITSDLFFNTMKRLKGEHTIFLKEETNVLDIGLTGDYAGIRVSINGDPYITEYCQKNEIKFIDGRAVKSLRKTPIKFVTINEYNIKVNLKREEFLDTNQKDIIDILKTWSKQNKTFRYKKRFTFVTKDNNFQFDLTMIKSSNKKSINAPNQKMKKKFIKPYMKKYIVKPSYVVDLDSWFEKLPENEEVEMKGKKSNQMIPTKSIQKSNVLQNNIEYEIELEYIGNKTPTLINDKVLLRNLMVNTILIMQSIQKSYFIISNKEKSLAIDSYKKLIGDYRFRGPQNVTLMLHHITEKNYDEYKNTINIRKGYSVTDKADGERNMLIITNNGDMYLLNRKNHVRKLDANCTELSESIFDCEYILKDKYGRNINMLMLFDVYFKNTEDLRERILYRTAEEKSKNILLESRQEVLTDCMEFLNNVRKSPRNNLIINKKTFFFGDDNTYTEEINRVILENKNLLLTLEENTTKYDEINNLITQLKSDTKIFRESKKLYGKEYPYHIDGLIFTPRSLKVGEEPDKEKKNIFNGRWYHSFKWKPPEENTIDFFIRYKKDENDKEPLVHYITKNETAIECRVLFLNVGYDPSKHTKHNSCRVFNENVTFDNMYTYVPFNPTEPYLKNIHICYLPIKNGNCYTEDNIIISDNSIVEFKYDAKDKDGFHWKPLRVRDTLRPNDFITANNVWNSIFNPVTLDMIQTGTIENVKNIKYYDNKTKRKDKSSKSMNDFHSFIKKKIIVDNLSGKRVLLDLGVGKAGDLNHWIDANCNTVIGLDVMKDNLDNINNGACNRLLTKYVSKENTELLDNTLMIWGDASKNLFSNEAGLDDLNKYYLDILYGNVDKNSINNSKLRNFYNIGTTIDLVVSNFAIHYFFENNDTLNTMLNNVSKSLNDNGKFVFTCIDGNNLFKILKENSNYMSSDMTWKITKKYKNNTFPNSEDSLGMKIDVYVESIGQTIEEYLVNIEYLKIIAEKHQLLFKTATNFKEIYNYVKSNNINYGSLQEMTDNLKDYSFLNNYYIFEKIKET